MSDFCVEEAMMDEKARLFGRIHLKNSESRFYGWSVFIGSLSTLQL